jgi:hypothetical protein
MIKSHLKGSVGFSFRAALTAVGILALAGTVSADGMKLSRHFNQPGNILIADQFNNRVIETDTAGNIIWSFGLGPNDFSARSIIGVNDAQRVGPFTLMAGTGTPADVIPQAPDGVPDNRVVLVDPFRQNRLAARPVRTSRLGPRPAGYAGAVYVAPGLSRPHHRPGQQPDY